MRDQCEKFLANEFPTDHWGESKKMCLEKADYEFSPLGKKNADNKNFFIYSLKNIGKMNLRELMKKLNSRKVLMDEVIKQIHYFIFKLKNMCKFNIVFLIFT